MKIIVFAGGSGRRLWPISRQSSPKQFEPIIDGKSTVQLALVRLEKMFDIGDIFISTNSKYLEILKKQLPHIPGENFIGEPARRDLAAAVGLAVAHLARRFDKSEPIGIVWGDNYMTKSDNFLGLLAAAQGVIDSKEAEMVFIGETPRFANNNLGWIGLGSKRGDVKGQPFFEYKSWTYRPSLDRCKEMFESGQFIWNTGYFVTTIGFVVQSYKLFQPDLWADLEEIQSVIGEAKYDEVLGQIYSRLPVASFDDAIVRNIENDQAVILHGDTGWSDPGTLYALKESINPDPEKNVEKGLVKAHKSADCLLYNYDNKKLLAAVGLEGMVVVNTEDALLVVHKDQIGLVKELVDEMIGSELEKYA